MKTIIEKRDFIEKMFDLYMRCETYYFEITEKEDFIVFVMSDEEGDEERIKL